MARLLMSWLVAVSLVGCSSDDSTGSKAGSGGTTPSGGAGGSGGSSTGGSVSTGGSAGAGGGGPCFDATRLWFDDFETGDYSRWTSQSYGDDWKNGFCHSNGFATDQAVTPTHSHRSEITCVSDESHRGYGGLQFDGDHLVPAHTNQGTGIVAPHGGDHTHRRWPEVPHASEIRRW